MKERLAKVMRGEPLTEGEAGAAMGAIMDGQATSAQIGAFLAALAVRGETEDEIVGFARTMRARAVPIRSKGAIDTCGTGGDGSHTFNISTVASLVVAACGVPVAKHGNRSARCGSADLLEALDVKIDAAPEAVQRSLDDHGWAFLFAPGFHAATRHAVLPRKEIGVRTAFNLLGPLTNPAQPEAQLVGVPRLELTSFLARCLMRLGVKRAWVVHGSGLDEISPAGETTVAAVEDGSLRTFTLRPQDAGLEPAPLESIKGGDAAHSAKIAREVLGGVRGPRRDVVVLNSAAALVVARRAPSLGEAARQAEQAIDDGAARALFERVREASHR